MEAALGAQSRASGYRGNVFSFQLDWDDIAKHMNKRTTDEQMKDWPHAPETVCNWIRVVLKHTDKNVDLMKHIKELRVRAHVVLDMARLHMHRHFDFLEERLTALEIKERVQNLEAEVKVGSTGSTRPRKATTPRKGKSLRSSKCKSTRTQKDSRNIASTLVRSSN